MLMCTKRWNLQARWETHGNEAIKASRSPMGLLSLHPVSRFSIYEVRQAQSKVPPFQGEGGVSHTGFSLCPLVAPSWRNTA